MTKQIAEVEGKLAVAHAVLRDRWPPATHVEQLEHELARAAGTLGRDWTLDPRGYGPRDTYRDQMLKIAALAVRAVEQLDGTPP